MGGMQQPHAPVFRRLAPAYRGGAPKPCMLGLTFAMNQWDRIYASPDYRLMIARKTRFIVAATIFFIIFYFALPVLVGYRPELMKREVWGVVNWAYIFAFSQFLMTWALAYIYMRIAERFDVINERIVAESADVKVDE